jgi:hypothetical protein
MTPATRGNAIQLSVMAPTYVHGGVVRDEDGVDVGKVDESRVRDSELDGRVDKNTTLYRRLSKLL